MLVTACGNPTVHHTLVTGYQPALAQRIGILHRALRATDGSLAGAVVEHAAGSIRPALPGCGASFGALAIRRQVMGHYWSST